VVAGVGIEMLEPSVEVAGTVVVVVVVVVESVATVVVGMLALKADTED